ncbi:hypothetical protein [Salinimonas iocasae]|uniref:Uncharacterized protein n=1 Tax=Salinimonas iocasae TaxID=2572577 RepID=A0A5B7YCP5_9ALTE|nr:hypothetical protein [Salinimonas iocasae]QCZ93305.1 hypothetical protein FBQ74_07310 [Salinimonas iocasae]
MEVEEKQDVEELGQSLEFAKKFFQIHSPQLVGDQIGELLVLKTLELVQSEAVDESHYYFTAVEIFEQINGEGNSEKARRWMKSHDENLAALFVQTSSLNVELANKGLSTLSIQRVEHKGGKANQWRVRTGKERVTSSSRNEAADIRYVVTALHDPMPWAKPFMNAILSPRILITVGVTLLLLVIIPIYTLLGIIDWSSKPVATSVVILGIFAGLMFHRLHELMNKGVTAFPVLWSRKLGRNKLFLSTSSGIEDNPLGMKAVTIEAKCSICGEDLIIDKSREFHGRYIGKCRIAPSEHVFSFDHITKRGKLLR